MVNLNMSYCLGTLNREVAADVVRSTKKKLYYRTGYAYNGSIPKEITVERALQVIQTIPYLDIKEIDTEIILNIIP